MNFDEMNDATGFANGMEFEDEQQVRDYFTIENMNHMFNDGTDFTQDDLDEMAESVIENRWHMRDAE